MSSIKDWGGRWSWPDWWQRFVTVFVSGMPINVAIDWLMDAGVAYLVAAPVVVVLVAMGVATTLTIQEGRDWKGWPRRLVVVLAPAVPINMAIGGLLTSGVPYWTAVLSVALLASAFVATVLTIQEGK